MQGEYNGKTRPACRVRALSVLSSFTIQPYNLYRIVAENLVKYVPPFRFYKVQFRPWLRSGPRWESLRRTSRPLYQPLRRLRAL